MQTRDLAALSVFSFVLSFAFFARAGPPAPKDASYRAFWARARVERSSTKTARLAISEEPGAAIFAACRAFATDGGHGAAFGDDTEVDAARHGATLTIESTPSSSLSCIVAPASESLYALRWIASAAASPTVAPSPDADRGASAIDDRAIARARTLALEATTPPQSGASSVIAVTGAVAARAVVDALSRTLGPPSQGVTQSMPASLHQSSERLSVLEDATHDPTVFTGWTVPSTADLDRASLATTLELLAGQGHSRLFRLLVRERSLSHRVEPWTANVGGNVLAGVTFDLSSRASVDRARRFLDGSIKQLSLVGPSRGEVERARARLELDALRRWEDPLTRARDLALAELESGDARRLLAEAARLDEVTPETIRRLAHDAFVDRARTTVEVYPPLFPYDDPRLLRHAMYTVASGDTLAAIALRFHSSVAAIARANDLDPRYSLSVGQGLWIPPE